MVDLIGVVELFRGTIFYTLIGVSSLFTIAKLGMFLNYRGKLKKRDIQFREILSGFVTGEQEKTEASEEHQWNNFFGELDQYKDKDRNDATIKEMKGLTDSFQRDVEASRKRRELLGDFKTQKENVYARWKNLAGRTFSLWFIFVIFASISIFILDEAFLAIFSPYSEFITILILSIGVILFPIWAVYAINGFRDFLYGDVEELLLYADDSQLRKDLETKFTDYLGVRQKRETLLHELTRSFDDTLVYGPTFATSRIIMTLLRRIRSRK